MIRSLARYATEHVAAVHPLRFSTYVLPLHCLELFAIHGVVRNYAVVAFSRHLDPFLHSVVHI